MNPVATAAPVSEANALPPEAHVASDFEAALQAHVSTHKGMSNDDRDLVVHVLSMPTRGILGLRRKNILARMERRARTELGLEANEEIDWTTIDWSAIIGILIKFLMMFLGL